MGSAAAMIPTDNLISFESLTDTLMVEDVELRIDFQLQDDDLGADLLIQSLEEQYRVMVDDSDSAEDKLLNLQSTKEWARTHSRNLGNLIRYVKSLTGQEL